MPRGVCVLPDVWKVTYAFVYPAHVPVFTARLNVSELRV